MCISLTRRAIFIITQKDASQILARPFISLSIYFTEKAIEIGKDNIGTTETAILIERDSKLFK